MRLRKWLKRLGIGIGALLLLVVLLIAGAWFYATSDSGSERIKTFGLKTLEDTLSGRLEVKQLRLKGGNIELHGAKLYTPEGELVAEVDDLTADVALLPLIKLTIDVRALELKGVRVWLVSDDRGLNLNRAIASKTPSPPSDKPGPNFTVFVHKLSLTESAADFVSGEQHYGAKDLAIAAAATVKGSALQIDGDVGLTGNLTFPLEGPLDVKVKAKTLEPDDVAFDIDLHAADAALDATLRIPSMAADIRSLVVPQKVLTAVVPQNPLKVPVTAKGQFSLEQTALELGLGKAKVSVAAKYALEDLRVDDLNIDAKDVDLDELLDVTRPSRINFTVKGKLTDTKPASLDGFLVVDGKWRTPKGDTIADLDVDVTAKNGQLLVKQLKALIPGVTVTASGKGSDSSLALIGVAKFDDLQTTAKALTEFIGGEPLPLKGKGGFDLNVKGPLTHPGVTVQGALDNFAFADNSLTGLTIDATVPDVARPFEVAGTLTAKQVKAAGRTLDNVVAKISTQGRKLDVEVSSTGFQDLLLKATGSVDKDGRGVQLDVLMVKWPENEWVMQQPVRIDLPDGGVTIEPALVLTQGPQKISIALVKKGPKLDAALDIVALDLSRLPGSFVPSEWKLQGSLDAAVKATGKLPRPAVTANLKVSNARVRELTEMQLDLTGSYEKDRVKAALNFSSSAGRIAGQYDGPVEALAQHRPEPLDATVDVTQVDLSKLATALEQQWPAMGQVRAKVLLSGTAAAPTGSVHVELNDAVVVVGDEDPSKVGYVPINTLALDVVPETNGELTANVTGRAFQSVIKVALKTPLTLISLRDKPPTVAQLKEMPVSLTAAIEHLELATVAGARLVNEPTLAGKVTMTMQATGTALKPTLDAKVVLSQVHALKLKPLDGEITIGTTAADTKLNIEVKREKVTTPILTLASRVEAPLGALWDAEKVLDAPVVLEAGLGPLTVADVWNPDPRNQQQLPTGTLKVQVSASGTSSNPKLRLRGVLDQVALGKVALGKANLALDYEKAVSTLSVALGSTGGGVFKARGELKLDMSRPAIAKGLDFKKAPVDVLVQAEAFDLAFLTNAVPMVRTVGGKLSANATIGATLGAPTVKGSANWNDGRLGLMGFGEYKDIWLGIEGNNQVVTLKQLKARSGGGTAEFNGELRLASAGHFTLQGQGTTNKFPVITDDQLRAIISLETDFNGELTEEVLDIRALHLPRVVVELPEVKSKDLQDISRPDDIVLVRNGQSVKKKKEKEAEAKAAGKTKTEVRPRVYRVTVDAPRNVWVRSGDLNIEVGLSEGFRVEVGESAQLFGEVEVKRGRIDVIGRRFDVQRNSSVRFSGPLMEPYINLVAEHVNEREGVTVYATVVGRGKEFSFKTSSNPPLSDSEIFTLLATGRRSLKRSGQGSSSITPEQAASVVGSFAAAQLKSVISKKVPIDVFSVEAGSDGLRGTKVETGKYLTDELYLGAQVQYGADPKKGENNIGARVEYQFTPHWAVEAYGGDSGAFGADLVWSVEY